jgi:hypothetical protein
MLRIAFRLVRRWQMVLLALAIAVSVTELTFAQRYMFQYAATETNARYDGRFTFARLKYDGSFGNTYYKGLPSWAHGYARTDTGVSAEHQMMQILDAISSVHPRINDSNVFALDDPELDKFPVSYMTEAGFWTLTDREARAFGAYLRKGGFVIFDDFRDPPRGGGGWPVFEQNMRRILPGARIVDLAPSHPIFHAFFDIDSFDIIPQFYDAARPTIRGIFENNDPSSRLVAIVNFNTDIANFWEYSGTGMTPVDESNEAFELGVNYIIYGLTH